MQHDAFFFIGIFAFIFLVWAATGGTSHSISFTGPTLSLPGALGGGTYITLPQANFGVGSSNAGSTDSSTSVSSVTSTTTIAGITYGTPSSYHGLVTLSGSITNAGSTVANESLTIYASTGASSPIDITGWTIESVASGNASVIPQGTEVPVSGIVNAAQDIMLSPGTRAIVTSGRSPVGASFRENKCVGYYVQYQTFVPALAKNCPTAPNELKSSYGADYLRDTACISYANTISRCQVVLTPPVGLTTACQSFISTYLNYNSCVTAHRSDTDFLSNQWRVYLGRTSPMWRTKNEEVKLLDASGKTVDVFTY